ncbi:diguanylate cyclase (GGDEF) domain-containing protein [Micromonospora citrea]|uniref:Diguanylate cyclase (GGDEF) domain-containing protein n=1 Tax=Micromonospora citrea TaxID=47855 RepID=A0A1C6TQA9_9ACTN|nr:GGDEF domain-containing protein [Micromonospora citrea]SCL43819.1 diguanylate cyclase (GGDEF) domain-containing protein [Micromonospora citrea]
MKARTVLLPAVAALSVAGHVWAARAVRSQRCRLAQARREATTDPLTGLANRAGLAAALDEMDGESYDLVLADLDKFKPVNDTWGHAAGDRLLVEIARRLREPLDGIDGAVVARIGGDEFVLACPSPAPMAQILGAEVIQALAAPIEVADGVAVSVTASVGAVHATAGEDRSRAFAAADAAAYEVKLRGGDGLVEHNVLTELPEVEQRPLVRLRELAALTHALGVAA